MALIKVLIVDDNSLCRKILVDILSSDDEIEIAGEAENGRQAIDMVNKLCPDIITMDAVMPVMDGLETIKHIMSTKATPILVISDINDSNLAFSAIAEGALETISKSDVNIDDCKKFINKIKSLSKVKVITHIKTKSVEHKRDETIFTVKSDKKQLDRLVAIASSTGGPKALSVLLARLPENFAYPIVIAQHISDGFVPGLVEWLDRVSKLNVKQAEEGEKISSGNIYVSPSETNMTIDSNEKIYFIERKEKDIYHPSCDALLSSIANVYGSGSIGVILTGMGNDGAVGMKKIKEAGGCTIAQDEESSVIYGMASVAVESGCIDKIMPLKQISEELVQMAE